MQGLSLEGQLARGSPFAAACSIRALAALLDSKILCTAHLQHGNQLNSYGLHSGATSMPEAAQDDRKWCLLTDGFMVQCIQIAQSCTSAHDKYIAVSALFACLQRLAALAAKAADHGSRQASSKQQQRDGSLINLSTDANNALSKHGEDTANAMNSHQRSASEVAPCISSTLAEAIVQLVLDSQSDRLKLIPAAALQAFATLCSILEMQGRQETSGIAAQDCSAHQPLQRIAQRLLALPADSKSRCALLAAAAPYLCVHKLLASHPDMMRECVEAMHGEALSPAGDLFSALLKGLHNELCSTSADVRGASAVDALQRWRASWVPHVVHMLLHFAGTVRTRAAAYTLPTILNVDRDSVWLLLHLFAPASAADAKKAAQKWSLEQPVPVPGAASPVILLLQHGKKAAIVDGLDDAIALSQASQEQQRPTDCAATTAAGTNGSAQHKACARLLQQAAVHQDEELRLQVLELAALHTKLASVCQFPLFVYVRCDR